MTPTQVSWCDRKLRGFYDPRFRQNFYQLMQQGNVRKAQTDKAIVTRWIRPQRPGTARINVRVKYKRPILIASNQK